MVFLLLSFPLTLLVVVVVSVFLDVAVVDTVSPSVVLGADDQLLPALLSPEEVADQIVLKELFPENVGQLGDQEDEGQHVGQPDVVVGHRGVHIRGEVSLVNVTSSGQAW